MISDFIALCHFICIFSLGNSFSCNFLVLFIYVIVAIHVQYFYQLFSNLIIKQLKLKLKLSEISFLIQSINILMRKFNLKEKSDNFSTQSQSYLKIKKINSVSHLKTLQNSRVSATSSINSNRGFCKIVKLSNSFYNDKNYLYLDVSQTLSQKLTQYQRRQISIYQRKKYESTQIQKVVQKRQRSLSHSTLLTKTHANFDKFNNKIIINQEALKSKTLCVHKQKFTNHSIAKYNKLISGSKDKLMNKKLLEKDIKYKLQTCNSSKWKSPFKNSNSVQDRFLGKKLVSVPKKNILMKSKTNKNLNPQFESPLAKEAYQLKVLNLDRMFRSKSGKLANIVPLPVTKLQSVNSRQFLMNKLKSKDRIHDVIEDYNNLLKIYKLNTNKVFLGIKGNHYIQTPSIQDIIGIKLRPKIKMPSVSEGISDEVFINNCQFYLKLIKKQQILANRLLSGLKMRSSGINLEAFTRFYVLFVTKVSNLPDKINFLSYFFIPNGVANADIQQVKQVLQVMCQKLPKIDKLNIKTDLLSAQQKSKIFLQALSRVLFLNINQQTTFLNRLNLQQILHNNEQAVDLLIKLLQLE